MKLLYQVAKVRPVQPEGSAEVILMPVEERVLNQESFAEEPPTGPIVMNLKGEAAEEFSLPVPPTPTPEQKFSGEILPPPAPKLVLVEFTVLEGEG